MIAVISLATAVIGLIGAVVNSVGWHAHARRDDARFAVVNAELDEVKDSGDE